MTITSMCQEAVETKADTVGAFMPEVDKLHGTPDSWMRNIQDALESLIHDVFECSRPDDFGFRLMNGPYPVGGPIGNFMAWQFTLEQWKMTPTCSEEEEDEGDEEAFGERSDLDEFGNPTSYLGGLDLECELISIASDDSDDDSDGPRPIRYDPDDPSYERFGRAVNRLLRIVDIGMHAEMWLHRHETANSLVIICTDDDEYRWKVTIRVPIEEGRFLHEETFEFVDGRRFEESVCIPGRCGMPLSKEERTFGSSEKRGRNDAHVQEEPALKRRKVAHKEFRVYNFCDDCLREFEMRDDEYFDTCMRCRSKASAKPSLVSLIDPDSSSDSCSDCGYGSEVDSDDVWDRVTCDVCGEYFVEMKPKDDRYIGTCLECAFEAFNPDRS